MAIPYSFTGTTTLAVDRVLLPLGIAVNAVGGPTTKTAIAESASGKESRFANMPTPRREYTGSFTPDDIAALLDIWMAGIGPRYGFMVLDRSDYSFVKVPFAVALTSGFSKGQLRKSYTRTSMWTGYSGRVAYRDILLPDPAYTTIYVNDVIDTSFTLTDDGIVQSSSTFASGAVITASCDRFYVPVRPADDRLDITMHISAVGNNAAQDVHSVQQIKFVEVLPGDMP